MASTLKMLWVSAIAQVILGVVCSVFGLVGVSRVTENPRFLAERGAFGIWMGIWVSTLILKRSNVVGVLIWKLKQVVLLSVFRLRRVDLEWLEQYSKRNND
jgi:hypothetical protein